VRARVAWVSEHPPIGIGLRFVDADPRDRARLQVLVANVAAAATHDAMWGGA